MSIQEIRKLYDARPFRAFTIHTADGRKIRVAHPEFMATAPTGRTVFVYLPDGSFEIIDVPLVTALVIASNGAGHRKSRR